MKTLKNISKHSFGTLFSLFFSGIIVSQEIKNLKDYKVVNFLTKNDTITFIHTYSQTKKNKKYPAILFIQGSLPNPLVSYDSKETWINLPFDARKYKDSVNIIFVKRKGVKLMTHKDSLKYYQENPTKEYLKYDNLQYRVIQSKAVINYLRNQDWVDKKNIFVIGHSEGYRVTAKLSEKNKKIKKIVCMSADPLDRISETIIRLQLENINKSNDSIRVKNIYKELNDFKNINNFTCKADDYDFKNWLSYNKEISYKSFDKYKNPILIVCGSDDIRSFTSNLIPFLLKNNKKIDLKIYPDLEHNFIRYVYNEKGELSEKSYNWDRVFEDTLIWLLQK